MTSITQPVPQLAHPAQLDPEHRQDDMDDDEKTFAVDTSVPYGERTRRLNMLEAISQLEQSTELSEIVVAKRGIKTYPLVKNRVRWKQRFRSWFRNKK